MGVFAVYNSHDSIEAKNLFAMQSEDDIFSDVYACTCVVHVEDAFLDEVYQGYGRLRKRELVIVGEVTGAFIEDYDERIFPCGAKQLQLMVPQETKIHWHLEATESGLISQLGCEYDDFELPPNLIGNDIEIPHYIKYQGIYESPVAAIEVLDPMNINTCTRENQYFGFFEACVPSKHVEAQKLTDYEFYPVPNYEELEQTAEYNLEEENTYEEEVALTTEEEVEDEASYAAVNELIAKQNAESEARRTAREQRAQDSKSIVSIVNAKLAKVAEQEQNDNQTNLWDIMSDDKPENKQVQHKASYEDFKSAAMEFEKQKAEEDKKKSEDAAANVDRAMDNMLLNEGITDIAGYTGSETSEQKKEKQDQKSGKKAIDAARNQDIAADNKALNEGITDIAGQGAAAPVKPSKVDASAQALVANLFGLTPNGNAQPAKNDEGQQFL